MSYSQMDNKQFWEEKNFQNNTKKEEQVGIIVPPGCENKMLLECGETVSTYIPSSYNPYVQKKNKRIIPHAMNGKTTIVSVPKSEIPLGTGSVAEYIIKFVNANICMDLWLGNNTKIKKCGVLLDVGKDFLVIKESNPVRISIIDLKPVYYINIYCKGVL